MCNVYRPVGSLTTIKSHLQQNNVAGFSSVNELIAFQKNYPANRLEIISEHESLITQEKENLLEEIAHSEQAISTKQATIEEDLRKKIEQLQHDLDSLSTSPGNIIQKLIHYFRKRSLERKIHVAEINFDSSVSFLLSDLNNALARKNNRCLFITHQFNEAVKDSAGPSLRELERKLNVINEINNAIYGAKGEQKVVKELEQLSNDFFLINDFCLSFSPPIYHRQENDYIRSIQVDHLLVSSAGIFIIETKNWSNQSLNNQKLRSPVQQIRRASFALYKILNGEVSGLLNISQHHWGERKIPIKNLIVLTNDKPNEEFQYVKVVTVGELLNYIRYFKNNFSHSETKAIAEYLLNLTNRFL